MTSVMSSTVQRGAIPELFSTVQYSMNVGKLRHRISCSYTMFAASSSSVMAVQYHCWLRWKEHIICPIRHFHHDYFKEVGDAAVIDHC